MYYIDAIMLGIGMWLLHVGTPTFADRLLLLVCIVVPLAHLAYFDKKKPTE
jgi:hypothetical protein